MMDCPCDELAPGALSGNAIEDTQGRIWKNDIKPLAHGKVDPQLRSTHY